VKWKLKYGELSDNFLADFAPQLVRQSDSKVRIISGSLKGRYHEKVREIMALEGRMSLK
jgi:transposase